MGNRIQVVFGEIGLIILTSIFYGLWQSLAVVCLCLIVNGIVGSFITELIKMTKPHEIHEICYKCNDSGFICLESNTQWHLCRCESCTNGESTRINCPRCKRDN